MIQSGSGGSSFGKVIWALLIGAGGLALMPPELRTSIKRGVVSVLDRMVEINQERRQQEAQLEARQREEARIQELPRIDLTAPKTTKTTPPRTITPSATSALQLLDNFPGPSSASIPDPMAEWLRAIPHPSTVLVLGGRGNGKSAFGYGLLEASRYRAKPYLVGLPRVSHKLVPSWIGHAPTIEDVPFDCTVLVDEASLQHHARESSSASARRLSKIVNLSRQRRQSLIFISQEGRQIDRSIVGGADVIVFKDPGMLQALSDRPELRSLASEAKDAFEDVVGDRRSWAYVIAPARGIKGMLRCPLPSFWTSELSHAFAGPVDAGDGSQPEPESIVDRMKVAVRLHDEGRSFGEIGRTMGVSRATAYNYVKGYPYRDQDPR